ncbi:MAG: hypothetical protein EOO40_09925 [Deltaproteobacteria bacterium]|nr:MAG: hypothetical protein EOO40_09925 [Deltaproteobacteria bacterium]
MAAAQLDFAAMGKQLLAEDALKFTNVQREEFNSLLQRLVRKISFSKGHALFKYLDAVLYAPATLSGTQTHCKSTIVVHRELKKEEIGIEWILQKTGATYQVIDMVAGGESTTGAIRQEQIQPLLQQGGPAAVLEAMRKKLEQ